MIPNQTKVMSHASLSYLILGSTIDRSVIESVFMTSECCGLEADGLGTVYWETDGMETYCMEMNGMKTDGLVPELSAGSTASSAFMTSEYLWSISGLGLGTCPWECQPD